VPKQDSPKNDGITIPETNEMLVHQMSSTPRHLVSTARHPLDH
jgi:hypothetical protein